MRVSSSQNGQSSPPGARAAAPRPIETAGELRQALTAEETRFFEELAALGPLWYRRNGFPQSAPAPAVGQRLDVRG